MHHRIDAIGGQRAIHKRGQRIDAHRHQIRKRRTDHAEGQIEYQRHDQHKRRNRGVFAGQHLIDSLAAQAFLALARMHHGLFAQLADEPEAHIRQRRHAILPAFLLHLGYDVFQHFHFVFFQIQLIQDQFIALDQLGGGKARGNSALSGVVLDQMHHGVDRAMHRAAVLALLFAEIHSARAIIVSHGVDGMADQFIDALVLHCGNRHHRNAQRLFQRVYVDRAAVFAHLVHHVQRQHHRHIQLDQLNGQIQVSFDVRSVQYVDDPVRALLQQKFARHDFLAGVGRERINAGQIRNRRFAVRANRTILAIHRHAREIAHVLIGSRQLVKQRGFSAVLIARQRERNRFARRNHFRPARIVFDALFRHAGMRNDHGAAFAAAEFMRLMNVLQFNLRRIRLAQRKLVAARANLQRIAQRRRLDHRNFRTGRKPHIQYVLAKRLFFTAHLMYNRVLSWRKLIQRQVQSPPDRLFTPSYYHIP